MPQELSPHWIILLFENGSAILKTGQKEIAVPRALIPKHIKEGDVVTAEFYLLRDELARKENLAKALLEEIMGDE